jgi:hypothetical protein
MRTARLVLAFAPCCVLGFAAEAPAQLASGVHVVTLANRACPPTNSCTSLLGASWYAGHQEAFRLVTSNFNPGGGFEGVYFPHSISYYYFDEALHLTRLRGADVEMPLGAAFNHLAVRGEHGCIYYHQSTFDNVVGNVTFLDEAALNGHPEAFPLVQHYFLGVFRNVGIYYDAARSKWGIFNEDLSAMSWDEFFTVYDNSCDIGLGFRGSITCSAPVGETCGGSLTGIASGDPAAKVLVTQLWSGVYNPHPIGVFYDPFDETWKVFNEDRADMPVNARFHVAVIRVLLTDDFETGDFSAWSTLNP